MKHAFFLLGGSVLALAILPLSAQDNHFGPVVYPTNSSPSVESVPLSNPPASAPDQPAPTTTSPSGTPVIVPPATVAPAPATPPGTAPAAPVSNPAMPVPLLPNFPPASTPMNNGAVSQPPNGSGALPSPLPPLPSLGPAVGNKADDIDDIRPPFFYLKPLTWLWVLVAAAVLLALGVALWIWLKPLRTRRAKSAYELALEKLEQARGLLDEKNPEPYAVFVSETIRSYLGQRFQTPSTRRTTEEFLRQMQTDASTPLAEHRDLLRGFLEACDLVKFAHYQPGHEELEQVQQRALTFVNATRPLEAASA